MTKITNRNIISVASLVVLAGIALGGCSSTNLRCKYQPGAVQTVRYTNQWQYKNWVEMPKKKPSVPSTKSSKIELVLQKQVQSVAPDGTALIKVTVKKALVTMHSDVRGKKTSLEYISDATHTKTDWPGEPALAGKSYFIKIAPDTTVKSIIGTNKLEKQMGLIDSKGNVAGGVVASLLSDEKIRERNELGFVLKAPESVNPGTTYVQYTPLPADMPGVMIKAKAIKNIFTVDGITNQDGKKIVNVSIKEEPLEALPEGISSTPKPNNFGQLMIKQNSTMNNFSATGKALFDLTNNTVLSSTRTTKCLLLLNGDNLGFGNKKKHTKGSGGEMFTEISMQTEYKVIK